MRVTYIVLYDIPRFAVIFSGVVRNERIVHAFLQRGADLAAHRVSCDSSSQFKSEDQQQQHRELER